MSKESQIEKVEKVGNSHVLHMEAGVYAVSSDYMDSSYENLLNKGKVDWEEQPTIVMGKRIVPYGENNDLPDMIRDIMDENNLAPGILERELGLLYGNGPQLYRLKYDSDQITREYVQDEEIQQWLESWDYKRYIDMAMVEYKYLKGVFVKRYRNRGARIGRRAYIRSLEVIPATDARLEYPKRPPFRLENVRRIYVGDFSHDCLHTGITTYPKYDPFDPFKDRVSIGYHNKYSFARSFYPVPSYYGSLKWIARSSDIPDVLAYLAKNSITSAYHIHSPEAYWKEKQEKLEKKYPEATEAFIDKKLDELKAEFFEKLAKVLTGKKNAGKFIDTVDFQDDMGNVISWKVEPIDQKIKDFIEAQIKISEKADSATTSGMGLHPSLSNIIVNGQLSSGSQMLYALKLYMASDTTIPEEVIFEALNQALAVNFPEKKLRMGFYHPTVQKEEEVPPEARTTQTAEK